MYELVINWSTGSYASGVYASLAEAKRAADAEIAEMTDYRRDAWRQGGNDSYQAEVTRPGYTYRGRRWPRSHAAWLFITATEEGIHPLTSDKARNATVW